MSKNKINDLNHWFVLVKDCTSCIKVDETRPDKILGLNIDADSGLLTSDPNCAEMESCSHLDTSKKCVVYTGSGTVHHEKGNFIIEGDKKERWNDKLNCYLWASYIDINISFYNLYQDELNKAKQ